MARLLRSKSTRELRSKSPLANVEEIPELPTEIVWSTDTEEPRNQVKMKMSTPLLRKKSFSVRREKGELAEESVQRRTLKKARKEPPVPTLTVSTYTTPRGSSSQQSLLTPVSSIGLAVGSPRDLNSKKSAYVWTPEHYTYTPSPAFAYPSDRFGVDTSIYADNKENTSHEGNRGWKKIFGRNLFHKKQPERSTVDSQVQVERPQLVTSKANNSQSSLPRYEGGSLRPRTAKTERSPSPLAMPVLDVDIPTVEMERYSVMFGTLLQDNNRRASLYSRRRSKLAGTTGTTADETYEEPPRLFLTTLKRNATTGQISRSPMHTPRSPDFFSAGSFRESASSPNFTVSHPSPYRRLSLQRDSTVMPSIYYMVRNPEDVGDLPQGGNEGHDNWEERSEKSVEKEVGDGTEDSAPLSATSSEVNQEADAEVEDKKGEEEAAVGLAVSYEKSPNPEAFSAAERTRNSFEADDDKWMQNDKSWLSSPTETINLPPTPDTSSPEFDKIRAAQASIERQISVCHQQLASLPLIRSRTGKSVITRLPNMHPAPVYRDSVRAEITE